MFFKDVVGQKEVIAQLIQEVKSDKIGHGQMLVGKSGYGTFPLAMAFSRYLLCENPGAHDACGNCASCAQLNSFQHPDLHFVYPVVQAIAKTSEHFLPTWRKMIGATPYFTQYDWLQMIDSKERKPIIGAEESESIIQKLKLKSYQGGYKVMVIFGADAMNPSCANKILKILEEPSPKTLFLLLVENPQAILATIQSRTQSIQVPKLLESDVSSYLQKEKNMEASKADAIARFADGDLCKALEVFQDGGATDEYRELFIQLMRSSYKKDVIEMMNWAETAASLSKENQKLFMLYTLHMIRQSFLMNYLGAQNANLTPSELGFVEKFSPFINGKNIREFMSEFDDAYYHLERNANQKILFTQLCFQCMRFIHRS
jgi:DNA polymerase-3 subunit delta'